MAQSFKHLKQIAPGRAAAEGKPEVGPTYRTAYAADGLDHVPATCYDLFKDSAEKFADRPCLGWRTKQDADGKTLGPYTFMTYKEAWDKSVQVGSAFLDLGLQPKDKVGVFGANSPEWFLTMQGCNRTSMECVPLYDTLGENAIDFILNHAEINFAVANGGKLPSLLKAMPKFTGKLRAVVYWGTAADSAIQGLRETEAVGRVLSWDEFLQWGAANPRDAIPPKAEDISTIMYTSGTTGDPKGVIHTHGSVSSEVEAIREFLEHHKVGLTCEDVYFSFLPLAHIFDRIVEEAMVLLGASVGYFAGDTRKLLDDCAALRPTIFVAVPRVYERIYAGVMDKVKAQGGLQTTVFNAALRYKQLWMRLGYKTTDASPLCNRIFFSKTQAAVGGRLRLVISGGAPLPEYAGRFIAAAMNVPVLQGYGLTESCGATIGQDPFDNTMMGTVGCPLPGVDLRLEAVPELGYLPNEPQAPKGEVCLRGPVMYAGYYKQPELTKESTDSEGFFHTGDIGELTPSGALRIIDRKKNIFKLSQGEYVAVEYIESVLGKAEMVEQIWIYGSSYESVLVAVVVPKQPAMKAWAKAQGGNLADKSFEQLCATPEATHYVLDGLTATGKDARLKGFEFPKAVHLDAEAFSIEHDLITPKMSLKRPQLLKYYKKQIDGMYSRLKQTGQAAKTKAPAPAAPAGHAAASPPHTTPAAAQI